MLWGEVSEHMREESEMDTLSDLDGRKPFCSSLHFSLPL